MKKLQFCLGAVVLLASCAALAQAPDPCKTQKNTVEINECAQQTLARKDKELNAAYQSLVKSLASDGKTDTTDYAGTKKLLQQAQRAWVQFRDSDCNAKYTLNAAGTIRDVAALSCKIEHTEQRTKQLKDWIKG
ncbi:lysozyme inhibitor LprI family protein [Variovorax sp. J2P1-59]|uniref:lysozyme inhibitor LprI family protein n=1 Tax=Variovorax flavidus TaxID=3053501 RepID=UPI002574A2A1|nr:lysozyme inhibitor LprI family protein [Variovorax sp. J2P1-59]MDM0074357.1 lysozyme inhibitor LprI family protein [Variovorax sp. J2P1-59]